MAAPASTPQVVVSVAAHEMATNFQGAYSSSVTYQPGQWVSEGEALYACVAESTNHAPSAAGSAFWRLIGALPN